MCSDEVYLVRWGLGGSHGVCLGSRGILEHGPSNVSLSGRLDRYCFPAKPF